MKRIIMKALLYIVPKKTNKKGLAPIYCRITVNGHRAEFSTGHFIAREHWQSECAAPINAEYIALNTTLTNIKSEVHRVYHELYNQDRPISATIIKQAFVSGNTAPPTFIELLNQFYEHKCASTTEINTLRTYKSRRALLLNYLFEKHLTHLLAVEFDTIHAERFINYQVNERRLARNYANRAITFTIECMRYGRKTKAIKFNPLADTRLKHEAPAPIVALDKAELLSLASYRFASTKLQQVADLYTFQSFTGLAYGDLRRFNFEKDVECIGGEYWIRQTRKKKTGEAILPLFDGAMRLLRKYKFKLPIISNQKYNDYIKEVADILNIHKSLSTHTARKTFAMVQLNNGFSLESVSAMLGHRSTKTTQKYYARVDMSRISAERARLGLK